MGIHTTRDRANVRKLMLPVWIVSWWPVGATEASTIQCLSLKQSNATVRGMRRAFEKYPDHDPKITVATERRLPDWSNSMIAALYVETGGCYADVAGVDAWDEARDARTYPGPHPVVAHPPCQRWGRFWHGSPRKPHQFTLGDDGGCFAAALASVRRWGGVLEHPADSLAWRHHGITAPPRTGGWHVADFRGGWTCYVEQGFYGHAARKGTWLYAHGVDLPSLRWGEGEQRLDPVMVARHGYEYARRKGLVSMIGGKRKTEIRTATPLEFRDVLISIAQTAPTKGE